MSVVKVDNGDDCTGAVKATCVPESMPSDRLDGVPIATMAPRGSTLDQSTRALGRWWWYEFVDH